MPPFWLLQPWNPQRSQQSCPELSALGFPTGFHADFFGEAAGGGVGKKSLGFIFFLHSKFLFPDAYRGENRSLKSSSVKHDSVEGEPVGLALSVCQFCFFFFFFTLCGMLLPCCFRQQPASFWTAVSPCRHWDSSQRRLQLGTWEAGAERQILWTCWIHLGKP